MHLLETSHQINMIFDHSVSSNTLFKKHLNVKSFQMFWEYGNSCANHDATASMFVAMVMWKYKGVVNSTLGENSKESSSSTISAEASFDDDSNKKALNVYKIRKKNWVWIIFKHLSPIITKKCTQCKTPHTLKIDVFELLDNKTIGKLSSKNELFFPNNLSQIPILQHPVPIFSLPPSPFLSNFALQNWNPKATILIMLFFGLPVSSYSISSHATSIGYTKAYVKTSQSNLLSCYIQIIKPYVDETHIHQIAETLRAASLSKLDNMVNSNSVFNTMCAEFSTKW